MGRKTRLGELLLATEGAALFRHLLDGDDAFVGARVQALQELAAAFDEPRLALGLEVPELDVETGYAAWAANYDVIDNALIRAEEPIVRTIADELPVGRALDAAC